MEYNIVRLKVERKTRCMLILNATKAKENNNKQTNLGVLVYAYEN